MKTFFINHTRKFIAPTELDAVFNISKNLREAIRGYAWSLDDHIEFVSSDDISHARGVKLIVEEKYALQDWYNNLRYILQEGSAEWKAIMLCDYDVPGPYGV